MVCAAIYVMHEERPKSSKAFMEELKTVSLTTMCCDLIVKKLYTHLHTFPIIHILCAITLQSHLSMALAKSV